MTCSERRVDDVVILELRGRFVLGAGFRLRPRVVELLDKGERQIALDIAGVTYMDSTSVGDVVMSWKEATDTDAILRLFGLGERLAQLFSFHHLNEILEPFVDEAAAIASFEAS